MVNNEYIQILMKSPIFRGIKEEEVVALTKCLDCKVKSYNLGEYIFHMHDEVEYIGVVIEGCVEIIKENISGEKHIMTFLEEANIFGEAIVCTSSRVATVAAIAHTDVVVTLIPYKRVIQSCNTACVFHNKLVSNMLRILADKNELLNMKMEILLLKGMRAKIATYLLREAESKNNFAFNITPNREALAEFLNVSRTSMCRELTRMKDDNLIDFYKNTFKLLDVNTLRECTKS